jgi:preprotein translocase subunit SecD
VRAAFLVMLAVLALAGCSTEVTGASAKDDSPKVGNVALVVPIEMRPVRTVSGDGFVVKDPQTGEKLTVDEPMMTIEQLDGAEISMDKNTGDWVLTIHLNDKDATTFEDWTRDHTGERLAVVVDKKAIIAPTIQQAISGGDIEISGSFTQKDVQDLLNKITGRG